MLHILTFYYKSYANKYCTYDKHLQENWFIHCQYPLNFYSDYKSWKTKVKMNEKRACKGK